MFEDLIVCSKIEEIGIRKSAAQRGLYIARLERDQPLGLGIWKRPEQDRVDYSEYGGASAYAQRECQGGGNGERGRLSKLPEGVNDISRENVDRREAAAVAEIFLHLCNASELAPGGV